VEQLRNLQDWWGSKKVVAENVNTDGDGKANFSLRKDAVESKTFVSCQVAGYVLALREIPTNADASLVLRLKKAGRPRHGRLLDMDGKPLAHVKLRVTRWHLSTDVDFERRIEAWVNAGLGPTVACDVEGRFTLAGFDEDTMITLETMGDQCINNRQHPLRFLGRAGLDTPVDLVVEYAGTIRGTVRLPDGSAAPGHWDICMQRSPVPWTGSATVSSGTFEMRGLPTEGLWRLSASCLDTNSSQWVCPTPIEVKLEPNKTLDIPITLTRGTPVPGNWLLQQTKRNPVSTLFQ
jgi:hypothetical protein